MTSSQAKARQPYTFADWKAHVLPPKGWDVADAVEDGWTRAEYDEFLRFSILPEGEVPEPDLYPDDDVAAPAPSRSGLPPASGGPIVARTVHPVADVLASIPLVFEVALKSEVHLAQTLAGQLRQAFGGRVTYADAAFWAWHGTEWTKIKDQDLRLVLHRFDGAIIGGGRANLNVGKRTIDNVLSEAATILGDPDFFAEPTLGLNAENGVICIDTDGSVRLHPHNPDDRFRFTIPASFGGANAGYDLPPDSYLAQLLDGAFRDDEDATAKKALVGEILGAAAFGMATRLAQPKAFVFLGESASNGKSTIASLLSALLPRGAVSAIPPSAYEDEKRVVHLAGKAANVADELSAAAIAGETLKAAVTGNAIQGRALYRDVVTFVPRAIHLFTTNSPPKFSGGLDRGLQRRLVVLPFTRTIPQSEIIPDIAERIRRDEMDLLLGLAIAGAQRLTRAGAYTIPPSSVQALTEWLMLDPVNEWFGERVVSLESEPLDGWRLTSELYRDFKGWAADRGHREKFLPNLNTFGQRLKAMPGVATRRRAAGTAVVGVGLREARSTSTIDYH